MCFLLSECCLVQAGLHIPRNNPSPLSRPSISQPSFRERAGIAGQALLEVSELPRPFTVAVSGDAPTLSSDRLLEAVAAVQRAPAVLGPDGDGGYYLVGLRGGFPLERRRAAYLEGRLGSGSVFEHTRAALGNPAVVAPCPDVDSAAALDHLAAELARDRTLAPNVAAWLDENPEVRRI